MSNKGRPTADEIKAKKANLFNGQDDLDPVDNIEFTPDPEDNEPDDKNHTPPKNDNQQSQERDPLLTQPVVEQEYTKVNAQVIGSMPNEIPEPQIQAPIIDFNEQPIEDPLGGPDPGEKEAPKPDRGEIKNPALDEASTRQKTAAAGYLVETVINAYVQLNALGKSYCTFTEEKLNRMALDGKFDFAVLDLKIPLSEDGDIISIGQFLDEINKQADQVFVVSEEFKEQARPLLLKIFKEKGWGMTPEQRLIALVIEDAAPKVMVAVAIRSQFNALIKMGTQMIQLNKQQHEQPSRPVSAEAKEVKTEEFQPAEEVTVEVVDARGDLKEPE